MENTNFYEFANKIYSTTGKTQAQLERETKKLRTYIESTVFVKVHVARGCSTPYAACLMACTRFWHGASNNLFTAADEVIKFVQAALNLADLYRNEGLIGERERHEVENAVARCVEAVYSSRPDLKEEICA